MNSVEVPLWALGGGGLAIFAWALFVRHTLAQVKASVSKLVYMHEHPEKYGFATGDTANLENSMCELTHYVRWWIKMSTGQEPPPYFRGNTS